MKAPPQGRWMKVRAFFASLLALSCLFLANGQAVAREETALLSRITERFCETVRQGYARQEPVRLTPVPEIRVYKRSDLGKSQGHDFGFHDVYFIEYEGKPAAVVTQQLDHHGVLTRKARQVDPQADFEAMKALERFGGPKVYGRILIDDGPAYRGDWGDVGGRRQATVVERLEGEELGHWDLGLKFPSAFQMTAKHFQSLESLLTRMWSEQVLLTDLQPGNIRAYRDGRIRPFDNWPVPWSRLNRSGGPRMYDGTAALSTLRDTLQIFRRQGWEGADAWLRRVEELQLRLDTGR